MNRDERQAAILGGGFSLLICGLIVAGNCSPAVWVPKPRYWSQATLSVDVCFIEPDTVRAAEILLPMACTFDFVFKDEVYGCEVDGLSAEGSVAMRSGTLPDGVGARTLWWVMEDGHRTKSALVIVDRETPELIAHELGHVCGYEHAYIGNIRANNHLMSWHDQRIGRDTRGMDLGLVDYEDG